MLDNKLLNTKFIGKDDWLIDKNLNHNEKYYSNTTRTQIKRIIS